VPTVLEGELTHSWFGHQVEALGDVTNDGIDDMAVSAPGTNFNTGTIYIYPGTTDSTLPSPYELVGEGPLGQAGSALASAGDIDGDGDQDFWIGSDSSISTSSGGGGDSGSGGRDTGDTGGSGGTGGSKLAEDQSGATYLLTGPITKSLALLDSPLIIRGGTESIETGRAIAGKGDINGDGAPEVMISALQASSSGGVDSGIVHLFYNSTVRGEISLSDSHAQFLGDGHGASAGKQTAIESDLNDDGYDDIVISSPNMGTTAGEVYLVLGQATEYRDEISLLAANTRIRGQHVNGFLGQSMASGFDVDGDRIDDLIMSYRGVDESAESFLYYGPLPKSGVMTIYDSDVFFSNRYGETTLGALNVASAGDFNGDHLDDILIGDPHYNYNEDSDSSVGRAYLILGQGI